MPEASPPTPESLEVKRRGRHRLIGAITLALMLVVFVPMILDSEPRRSVQAPEVPLAIPPKDGLPPLPAPVAQLPKPEANVEAKPEVKAETKLADSAPVQTAPAGAETKPGVVAAKGREPQAASTKEPKAVTEEVPGKPSAKAPEKAPDQEKKVQKVVEKQEGFAIQLGAFSEAEKINALKAKMKSAKIPVFTEPVSAANGKLTRLRAGPYKTREQAEKALLQVKKQGVDGKIVSLP